MSPKYSLIRGLSTLLKTMPVEGLPKTMETLLSSLIQGNALLSWQIYQDKVGNVHMNIKFSGESVTHDQASVSYRRKPPAQVKTNLDNLYDLITL